MFRVLSLLVFLFIATAASSQTIFIVRHGEKAPPDATTGNDVALSATGKERAEMLKTILKEGNIKQVFSTNTLRTKSTAQPTADHMQVQIQTYGPFPDAAFVKMVQELRTNTLIVGHSNTVDDLVNMISGEKLIPSDLPDSEYDNLFVLAKMGDKWILEKRKFGAVSN